MNRVRLIWLPKGVGVEDRGRQAIGICLTRIFLFSKSLKPSIVAGILI
jgi:hypothetical protein